MYEAQVEVYLKDPRFVIRAWSVRDLELTLDILIGRAMHTPLFELGAGI